MAIKAQLFGTGVASVGTQQKNQVELETDQKKPGNQVSCKPCSDARGAILLKLISSVKLLAS